MGKFDIDTESHLIGDYCHFEFCWRCFASYVSIHEDGNTAHKEDCPWHPNQLDTIGPPDSDGEDDEIVDSSDEELDDED